MLDVSSRLGTTAPDGLEPRTGEASGSNSLRHKILGSTPLDV